jgi:hypothetical protein
VINELKDHDLSVFDRMIIMHYWMQIIIYKLMNINFLPIKTWILLGHSI